MRLRNWLLAGTSLAGLALVPGVASAQQAEYQALIDAQASGDASAVEAAQQALTEACIVKGYASLDECIAALQNGDQFGVEPQAPAAEEAPAGEPAAEEPAPVEEPAPAEEQQPAAEEPAPAPEEAAPVQEEPAPAAEEPAPAAEEPAPAAEEPAPVEEQAPAPSTDDQNAQFIADLQAAVDAYQAAIAQANSGDYAGGKAAGDAARDNILALCTANGYPDIVSCIGQELPPIPEAPAEQQAPAEQPAPADQQQPAAPDPAAEAQAKLQQAAELYGVGANQLDAGDPAGQSTVDAANNQFAQICADLGIADVAQCLAQYGIELPPLPATPVAPTEPQGTPISELPGAEEAVTPEATEVLPENVAPEEAAPVLDSAKDMTAEGAEAPTAQPPAEEEPAAPPPTNDQEAQSAIAPTEVTPIADMKGEEVQAEALAPPPPPPQNVTVINNVTNVNVTNNNTTINNNSNNNNTTETGGRPRGDRPSYTDNSFVFKIGVNLVLSNPASDFDRITDSDEDFVYYERLSGGRVKETVERPNGVKIVTIRNKYGEILKRSRITPDGREYVLAYYNDDDEEDDFFNWRDPGQDLPPLRLNIPIRDYILDADEADEEEVELFFRQPPVEQVRKIYTIDDVKRSARLRDSVRRVEVGGLTFDSGAATISRSQIGALSKVANAMLALLKDNPAETFLIEGHTDAVGPDQANLVLSDARATTVARILTDFYDVPPENLVTQGYGERYLKVKTEAAERLNRRVSIKRITSLITLSDRN